MRAVSPVSILLLLALAAAGCAEPDAGAPTDPAGTTAPGPTTGASLPSTAPAAPSATSTGTPGPMAAAGPVIRLTGCQNFGAVFPVPMDSARGALPAGFEPVATPSDPAGGATLYVLGVRCAGSDVDGANLGEATLAYAELAVVPPQDQAVAGVADATVPLVFAATPQPLGDAFSALRLGQVGFGEVTWAEHTGSGDVIVAATLGDAAFTLRGAYAPTPPGGLGSGDFLLYGVQDGAVQAKVLGSSAGGEAVDAAVALESAGIPLLAEARPAARGFSVAGFDLSFRPT